MSKLDPWGRKQESRRWRKFKRQPREFFDWPCPEWEEGSKRYRQRMGDPILVYDRCNGYSLWFDTEDRPPPAEWWIAVRDRPPINARSVEGRE